MKCTFEVIVALLGFTPQPGTIVNVPAAYVERLTEAQRYLARSCARRHGIRWRIVSWEKGRVG